MLDMCNSKVLGWSLQKLGHHFVTHSFLIVVVLWWWWWWWWWCCCCCVVCCAFDIIVIVIVIVIFGVVVAVVVVVLLIFVFASVAIVIVAVALVAADCVIVVVTLCCCGSFWLMFCKWSQLSISNMCTTCSALCDYCSLGSSSLAIWRWAKITRNWINFWTVIQFLAIIATIVVKIFKVVFLVHAKTDCKTVAATKVL